MACGGVSGALGASTPNVRPAAVRVQKCELENAQIEIITYVRAENRPVLVIRSVTLGLVTTLLIGEQRPVNSEPEIQKWYLLFPTSLIGIIVNFPVENTII